MEIIRLVVFSRRRDLHGLVVFPQNGWCAHPKDVCISPPPQGPPKINPPKTFSILQPAPVKEVLVIGGPEGLGVIS